MSQHRRRPPGMPPISPPGFDRVPVRDIRPGDIVPFNGRQVEVTRIVRGRNNIGVEAKGIGFTIVWGVDEDFDFDVEDPNFDHEPEPEPEPVGDEP